MIASCQLTVGHGETSDKEEISGAPSGCWVQRRVRGPEQAGLQPQEAHALETTAQQTAGRPGIGVGGPEHPGRLKEDEAAPVRALGVSWRSRH